MEALDRLGAGHGRFTRRPQLMARLRLFANLREIAGSAELEIDAATVGAALDTVTAEFGPGFGAGLETARIWVNGDPAERTTPVAPGDEIAVIPPVSGGETIAEPSTQAFQAVLVLALLGAIVIANFVSLEVFVFVVVGAGLAYLWDLNDAAALRGQSLNMIPPLLAVAAAANGAYRWGFGGFTGGVLLGVMIALSWAVFDGTHRRLDDLATTVLLALVGGLGAGGLVLVRMRAVEEVTAFLAVAAAAGIAAWASQRFGGSIRFLDPNLASIAGALVAGLIAGLVAGVLDLAVTLLASAGAAAGIVAGRVFGSLVRTGMIQHTVRPPGLLAVFDGPYLAAGVFWLVLMIFG